MPYNTRRIRKNKSLASDMIHKIFFQSYQPSEDGEGGFVDAWVDVKVTWASINPIRAHQRTMYKSISTDTTHIVEIRGNVPCNDTQQIRYGERVFEILTVEDIQERSITKIVTCKELSR